MTPFNLTVITYHYVRDVAGTEFPHLKTLAVADFERQLDFLKKNYTIISWPDLVAFLEKGAALPEHACLLTFDDGTKDHYTNVFRCLKKRGLSGLFFAIAPNNPNELRPTHILQLLLAKFGYEPFRRMFEEKLSIAEQNEFLRLISEYVKNHPEGKFGEVESRAFRKVIQSTFLPTARPMLINLAATYLSGINDKSFYLIHSETDEMARGGMFFGGHGKRHEYMTLMLDSEIREELRASHEFLKTIHPGPYAFNYPYGIYNNTAIKLVQEAGFLGAFATDNKGPAQTDQFEIHRLDATLFLSVL